MSRSGTLAGDRDVAGASQDDPGRPDGRRVSVPGGSFIRIPPGTLEALLGGGEFALVNVHIPFEGKISGTDLFVPYDEIARPENLERLPGKDSRIVLYCRGGPMSHEASRTLVVLGYRDVYDLEGGMEAWSDPGSRSKGPEGTGAPAGPRPPWTTAGGWCTIPAVILAARRSVTRALPPLVVLWLAFAVLGGVVFVPQHQGPFDADHGPDAGLCAATAAVLFVAIVRPSRRPVAPVGRTPRRTPLTARATPSHGRHPRRAMPRPPSVPLRRTLQVFLI